MTVQTSRPARGENREIVGGAAASERPAVPNQAWLMDELKLSPREFGLLGSSFYLLFAVSAVVTGFIVNRVETRWALLVMGFVWALTQFPMIGTAGFATIM